MASMIAKVVAKQIMGGQMKKYQDKKVGGPTDPYFTYVVDPRTGKEKKAKKQVPDYIPDHDAIILAKMRNRSYKLDMCLFDIAGIRFGWSSVIGIVPAFGDAADALLALLLVWRCSKIECGLGPTAIVTMLVNVLIDFVIGIIPFLGDIADAAFKANTRNVRVLEKRLDEAYKPKGLKTKDAEYQKKVREERRKSGMTYNQDYEAPPATVVEEFSDDELDERRQFVDQGRADDRRAGTTGVNNTVPPSTNTPAVNGAAGNVARPQAAAVKNSQAKRGSWFSGFKPGSSQRQDAETGRVQPVTENRNIPNQ